MTVYRRRPLGDYINHNQFRYLRIAWARVEYKSHCKLVYNHVSIISIGSLRYQTRVKDLAPNVSLLSYIIKPALSCQNTEFSN